MSSAPSAILTRKPSESRRTRRTRRTRKNRHLVTHTDFTCEIKYRRHKSPFRVFRVFRAFRVSEENTRQNHGGHRGHGKRGCLLKSPHLLKETLKRTRVPSASSVFSAPSAILTQTRLPRFIDKEDDKNSTLPC